jgi:hypothetical protein
LGAAKIGEGRADPVFIEEIPKKEDIEALINNLNTKRRKLEQEDLIESIKHFLSAVDSQGGPR